MKADFLSVDGLDGVHVARLGKSNCIALRLNDGGLCLYSPVAGLEKAFVRQVSKLGEVSALLAPNHYHNKGLKAHRETFPNASLYCSAAAKPRLEKVTGLKFGALDHLGERLPERAALHEPKGLKTGEVWLQIDAPAARALVVTDAFSAAAHPPGVYADRADMLGTFSRYGVENADVYKGWATEFLSVATPSILLPCHGSPIKSVDLTSQLSSLIDDML